MNINNPVNDRKTGTQYATKESVQLAKGRKNIDCSSSSIMFKCPPYLYLESNYSCAWNSGTRTTIARITKI